MSRKAAFFIGTGVITSNVTEFVTFSVIVRQKILLVFEKVALKETISRWGKISDGGH
jgi:hypothetical protein